MGLAGETDVSAIVTTAVVPTWIERALSENNLICSVSVLSVCWSLAREWEKLNLPSAATDPSL